MNLSPEQREEYGLDEEFPPKGIIIKAWIYAGAVGFLVWLAAWVIGTVTYPWVAG